VTVSHLGGSLAAGAATGAQRLVFTGAARIPWLVGPVLAGAIRLNLRGLDRRLADPRAAARWFFDGPAKGAQIAAVEAYIDSTDPDDLAAELRAVAEAARTIDTVVGDAAAYAYPWPFDVGALRVPVEVWHGERTQLRRSDRHGNSPQRFRTRQSTPSSVRGILSSTHTPTRSRHR
jgi:hypothetical protein